MFDTGLNRPTNHQRRCRPDGDEEGSEPAGFSDDSKDTRACHRNAMARIPISSRNQSTTKAARWRPGGFIAWPLAPLLCLVCVITLCVLKIAEGERTGGWWLSERIGDVCQRVSSDSNQPAKMGGVFWSTREHVEVFGPTPQINESLKSLRGDEVLRSNRRNRRGAAIYIRLRENYASAYLRIGLREDMSFRQRGIADFAFNMARQPSSRRAAGVFPVRFETPTVQIGGGVMEPLLFEAVSRDESALIRDQRFFDKLCLLFNGKPLATREQSVEETDDQQTELNEHGWCVPRFIFGVLLFSASFLLGMKSDQRVAQRRLGRIVEGKRDRWFWLSLLCDIGLFIGAFLMFIWPRVS